MVRSARSDERIPPEDVSETAKCMPMQPYGTRRPSSSLGTFMPPALTSSHASCCPPNFRVNRMTLLTLRFLWARFSLLRRNLRRHYTALFKLGNMHSFSNVLDRIILIVRPMFRKISSSELWLSGTLRHSHKLSHF